MILFGLQAQPYECQGRAAWDGLFQQLIWEPKTTNELTLNLVWNVTSALLDTHIIMRPKTFSHSGKDLHFIACMPKTICESILYWSHWNLCPPTLLCYADNNRSCSLLFGSLWPFFIFKRSLKRLLYRLYPFFIALNLGTEDHLCWDKHWIFLFPFHLSCFAQTKWDCRKALLCFNGNGWPFQ